MEPPQPLAMDVGWGKGGREEPKQSPDVLKLLVLSLGLSSPDFLSFF